ncbi:hypothetical protein LMH87_007316 [Akanthomyces muscarius]|uniref:Uncharacterized protein n=1 Tax=Akanthomyces muscarius TaxID=2231603 RepID=A0A9W8QPG7_AKAMU|nr:hypothetical protein LMH87_007316 [Akanthomyces muscarius]KAJ4165693.1 hypothetical protein LMH87_007316 [Akanthomyces muscarius]
MDTTHSAQLASARHSVRCALTSVSSAAFFMWKWSIPYRNRNLPQDDDYAAIWKTDLDEACIRAALHSVFPNIALDQLPVQEEHIRQLIRQSLPPINEAQEMTIEKETRQKQLWEREPEEAWPQVPESIRRMLAAANASNMEKKLQLLTEEEYHSSQGLRALLRHKSSVTKSFRMWRHGFAAAVSRTERIGVNIFFIFLIFCAVYPNVAAGFLDERSYNQRSIGSRIMTFFQLFFLWTFPYHSLWLLFNWSLERLLGGLVGSTVYAFIAIFPAVRIAYKEPWFRTMILVLTIAWQMGVQFSPLVREYVVRLLTRHQTSRSRRSGKHGTIYWASVDKALHRELVSLEAYTEKQSRSGATLQPWQEVPIKVRTERYIRFTHCFKVGRGAEQLIGLLKDDMEGIVNIYQDYLSSARALPPDEDAPEKNVKDHMEPRLPKLMLVIFDIFIFAYVCFSFWSQPFTFNTVVAWSAVVIFKQTIILCKRYQTVANASRLFTNMVAFNIWGIFLVSLPVTIDKNVLQDNGTWAALTLAMVLATIFLIEPIAPLFLILTEKMVTGSLWLEDKLKRK